MLIIAFLSCRTEKHGDDAPELADVYFAYGRALLENAISQSSVLGKDQAEEALAGDKGKCHNHTKSTVRTDGVGYGTEDEVANKNAFLSFSGDPEDDEPVDLFGQASKAAEEDDDEDDENEEEGDGGEPEDDFNAAWEVLDLARALYEKQQDESDEIKLKLAETYICLGDVSLETGQSTLCSLFLPLILNLRREIRPSHH